MASRSSSDSRSAVARYCVQPATAIDTAQTTRAASAIAATDLGAWSYDLTVAGLRGATDYAACLAWLQGLSIVERVSVRAAAPAQVTFRLDLTAMPRYLEDAIANGRLLEYDAEQDRYRMRGVADER